MSLRRRNKKPKKLGMYTLIGILLVAFVYVGIPQRIAQVVLVPFVYIGDTTKSAASVIRSSFIPDSVLLEENRILKEQIATLERERVLQDSEGLLSEDDFVKGKVLLRPPHNIYGSLLLQKQGDGNVRVDDVVVTREGAFIGVVNEVQSSLIRVTLSSHPGFSQDLTVSRSGIPVTMVGVGGGNMKAELPQGADIQKSDVLVDLPTRRVVAEVGEIVVDDTSAFITAYMRMPINIFEVVEVFIVPTVTQ